MRATCPPALKIEGWIDPTFASLANYGLREGDWGRGTHGHGESQRMGLLGLKEESARLTRT